MKSTAGSTARSLTDQDARRIFFGHFDMIFHECLLLDRFGMDVATARSPNSWIYYYRDTNIIFVTQRLMGGPAAVIRGIKLYEITDKTISDFLSVNQSRIVANLEKKPIYEFPGERIVPADLDSDLDQASASFDVPEEHSDERTDDEHDEVEVHCSKDCTPSVAAVSGAKFMVDDVSVTDTSQLGVNINGTSPIQLQFAPVPPKWKKRTQTFQSVRQTGFHQLFQSQVVQYRPVFKVVICIPQDNKLDGIDSTIVARYFPGLFHYRQGLITKFYPQIITDSVECLELGMRTALFISRKTKMKYQYLRADQINLLDYGDLGSLIRIIDKLLRQP